MTHAERRAAARRMGERVTVRAVTDRAELRRTLAEHRPYAAYALGQLDPALFRLTSWWVAVGERDRALVLHSRGGLGNATFTLGAPAQLDVLLALHPGPRHTFLTCAPHHLETVLRYFDLDQRQTMIRMQVTRETFRPSYGDVRRLGGDDARDLNRLYRTDGVPSFYSPRQLEEAVYFGVERDGRLVAVAGTHVISHDSEIAVVGNVYTHPRYRGQHFAQATTSAVTEVLLRSCREVVLSVDPTNEAAVRAYQRLGYAEVARLIEGAASRREMTGAAAAARRALARLRGRQQGVEVVELARP